MITKTFTGINSKTFVKHANDLLTEKNFDNIIYDMILNA